MKYTTMSANTSNRDMPSQTEGSSLLMNSVKAVPAYDSTETSTTSQSSKVKHKRTKDRKMKLKRKQWSRRRQSSESALIHITGTGTLLEDTFDTSKYYSAFSSHSESSQEIDHLPHNIAGYDDFHTIDWQRDLARDRHRHRYITKKMKENVWNAIKGYYDAMSGWICVLLVGLTAGCVAAFINIGEEWMKDLKEGVCEEAYFLNKEQCCWSSNDTFYAGSKCNKWKYWVEYVNSNLTSMQTYSISYGSYVLWSIFFGALASCMVRVLAPYACGSGVPEIKTILSGFIMRGYFGKMTFLVKSMTVMMAVAAGLSLGMEGPLVHVVCCIGNILSYLFPKYGKNEAKKREILSAASAAGVSVAFNAPIGGILFSLEEVSYYFPLKTLWRSFFCALVAAFVFTSAKASGGELPLKYHVSTTRSWILIELLPFIILGILGGIIGAAFIRSNIAWCKLRKESKLGNYPIVEVITITLITALIKYPNEFTRQPLSNLIKMLFNECGLHDTGLMCDYERNRSSLGKYSEITDIGAGIHQSLYLLALSLCVTWFLTVFTFGMKIPTGLFIPSMAMGAILGRIVGIGVQKVAITYKDSWLFHTTCPPNEDCMSPGLYAMIGAAACLAGITRMTVSLVVIMFELTGSVEYIVPLMATVVASKWVGDALGKEGIYDAHIRLNKYPFLNNKDEFKEWTMPVDLTAEIRANSDPLCCFCQEGFTLRQIEQTLEKTTHIGFPVIVSSEEPFLIGYVLRRDIILALDYWKKKDGISSSSEVYFTGTVTDVKKSSSPIFLNKIVDMAPITVTIRTPVESVIDMFRKLGLRQVLVTDNGMLVEIITKKDLLSYIRRIDMYKVHEEEQ